MSENAKVRNSREWSSRFAQHCSYSKHIYNFKWKATCSILEWYSQVTEGRAMRLADWKTSAVLREIHSSAVYKTWAFKERSFQSGLCSDPHLLYVHEPE